MLVSIVDWSLQGAFLLLTFVQPWFLRLGQWSRAFGRPFLAGIVWGIWRVFYFDPTTGNDIPSMDYFAAPFIAGIYSLVFYAIRRVILRRRVKPNGPDA